MADCLVQNPNLLTPPKFNKKEDSFESESTTSSSDLSTAQNSLDTLNNNEVIPNFLKPVNSVTASPKAEEAAEKKPINKWKLFLVVFGILLLFAGRFNVPVHDVKGLEDNVLDLLLPINNWIHAHADSWIPKIMLFCCATNMDLIFFVTVFYWFKYGTTGRLPIAITVFYSIRTFVQMMSYQPYPAGYYWDSPGFPSFVAPYGRSTDFFFSGHSGFLVLMANEWGRVGHKWVQRYIHVTLVYTIFVLLACQAHYSIDIFTGVFFADYVFGKIDENKDIIDGFFRRFTKGAENIFAKTFMKGEEKVVEKKNE